MRQRINRKLLVSVYNPQEARDAVLGGGRIIDSEDPKSALGNISPLRIMELSEAVLDYKRSLEVQLSTNIGEDQLIFRRTSSGRAVEKSPQEMAGKAAQAALGVALAMGTRVHPCNIVKVGLDGMPRDQLRDVLSEVVRTLRRTSELRECQVMSVLFAQDLELWKERKCVSSVREELVALREFSPAFGKTKRDPKECFSLSDYWQKLNLRELDENGHWVTVPKPDAPAARLNLLKKHGILPEEAINDEVVVSELIPHFTTSESKKTTVDDIRTMVDLTVEAGANAIMLDTSILSKVSNICLVDTSDSEMAHLSPHLKKNGLTQRGILRLPELEFFVDYCHYKGIVPNIAGSVDSIQAQQLWALLPKLDQVSTRSAASAAIVAPLAPGAATDPNAANAVDSRQLRTIVRELVAGLAPPEHGGVLNLPASLRQEPGAAATIRQLRAILSDYRQKEGFEPLETYWVESNGTRARLEDDPFRPPSAPPAQSPTPAIN